MRLIDADKLLKGKEDHQMISTHLIWNAPTIDAVPVVRCKDCKYLLPNDRIAPNWWRICDYWRTGMNENEYCSRGEMKEE